jgi:murein DD-endopeptidase MepM/ murein hydrolase activator NlpD
MSFRKHYTFFVVSNSSGSSRKFVIPAVWVRFALLATSLIALVLIAGLFDYFGLLVQSIENKKLKIENAQLHQQFQAVEMKVSSLESSLDRVKNFTQKLQLITNIDAKDQTLQLTVSNKTSTAQVSEDYEPLEQRLSSTGLVEQDQLFPNEKTVSEELGEVVEKESSKDYATLVIRIDKAVKETQLKEQSVLELWESLSDRQSLLNAIPNIRPARGMLTSRFGRRINPVTGQPAMHAGLDIAAAPGSPVYAPADGVVTFASYDESYGKLVSIDHGYGISTRFGHNSQIYVHVGQKVSKYDVIAAVGNTGRSTGPHLHYEVRKFGVPVDPINYILDE